jgi:hypothetical protein
MRVLACCLLVLGALALSGHDRVAAEAARCAPASSANPQPVKSRPSSFAPHHGGRHVYGQPIQAPILKTAHHPPRKPPPQP